MNELPMNNNYFLTAWKLRMKAETIQPISQQESSIEIKSYYRENDEAERKKQKNKKQLTEFKKLFNLMSVNVWTQTEGRRAG